MGRKKEPGGMGGGGGGRKKNSNFRRLSGILDRATTTTN